MKNIFHNGATEYPIYYLWAGDEKIEYAHVHPNFLNRD